MHTRKMDKDKPSFSTQPLSTRMPIQRLSYSESSKAGGGDENSEPGTPGSQPAQKKLRRRKSAEAAQDEDAELEKEPRQKGGSKKGDKKGGKQGQGKGAPG